MAAIDTGHSVADGIYDPRPNLKGRSFAKGVSCVCCMGGNCHAVGHVVDICDCSCVFKSEVTDMEIRSIARQFKYAYYGAQCAWDGRMRGNGEDSSSLEWGVLVCRRFLCTEGGLCREEPGCGRDKECGDCFLRTNTTSWNQGTPFTPLRVQLRWINEFLSWAQAETIFRRANRGVHEREVNVVTTLREENSVGMRLRRELQYLPQERVHLEECTFGYQEMVYPERRPRRRLVPNTLATTEVEKWFEQSGIKIGSFLTTQQRHQVLNLLYVWNDLFVEKLRELPATDLVCHTIPTIPGARPYKAKDPIYAADEVRWQSRMIPEMLGTIIQSGMSPWAVKTTWVSKKETTLDSVGRWPLRMVHTYCPLNNVTIKANYPMKRIEPILEDLSRPGRRYFFSADAAYGFYAIPIYPPHAYKTAFNSILGQFYYTRMPMGLTGAPATYARLKDITFGPIPAPNPEPSIISVIADGSRKPRKVGFRYFFDDDYGAADTFEDMLWFLREWYFPRIEWAKLTLKPSKSSFFVPEIDPLGMTVNSEGLRASNRKQNKISTYPTPTSEKEIDDFLHLTIYLKALIPGRTEHARLMKEAVIRESDSKDSGLSKAKKKGKTVGFMWGQTQQDSFDHIKKAVLDNVIVGGDCSRRYYISVCADKHGFGSVLFQLKDEDEERWALGKGKGFPKGQERVVQFIAQTFSDTESRYLDVERECLAILRTLEEVRFLILNAKYPVVVYSDAAALISILGKDDSKGRIAGWRVRISEYNIEPRVAKTKDMAIADGLSRMPYESMDEAWTRDKEWENVCAVDAKVMREREQRQYIPNPADTLTYDPNVGIILNDSAQIVYCDGASRRGKDGIPANASIGVYFGPDNAKNFGKYVPISLSQTNQVAELIALYEAIRVTVATTGELTSLIVATDSEYVYKGVTEWIHKWKQEAGGLTRIQNGYLFLKIDTLIQDLQERGLMVRIWKIPRELNQGADRIAGNLQKRGEYQDVQANVSRVGDAMSPEVSKWDKWMKDDWYTDIVYFLLREHLPPRPTDEIDELEEIEDGLTESSRRMKLARKLQADHSDIRRFRKTRADSKKFSLWENADGLGHSLIYKEVNGDKSRCIVRGEVTRILHRFHDLHGHFAADVMSRNVMGKYYWPGRMKDIVKWCHSCESCQMMGPRRTSTSPKMVMALQPMDLMGMDFLGPITPNSRSGSVYIIIAVDYFSRYLFAHATQRNNGDTVVRFLEERIARTFGWPLAFYVDNGSHFVGGKLPAKLKSVGTKMFTAPVSNPSSVGLAERYVQLILAGLRVRVQDTSTMDRWDEFLDEVVHAINTRVLRIHGYTPAQLFVGFNVRLHSLDESVVESMRKEMLQEQIEHRGVIDSEGISVGERDEWLEKAHYDTRLAALEEIRELTRDRVMRSQEERELKMMVPRYAMPRVGDLVLRRRFVVDKSLGMKLYAKWDGPYRLISTSHTGTSGDIQDLKTGRHLGRYAFNTLKVFVPRNMMDIGSMEWVSFDEGLGRLCGKFSRDCNLHS